MNEFHKILQNLNDDIKFTCDNYEDTVTFLGITVYKAEGAVETDIYYKKTETQKYLNYHSHHPQHVRNNVPFNLAGRVRTIVSDERK